MAQTMYTHVSKCKNNKKKEKEQKYMWAYLHIIIYFKTTLKGVQNISYFQIV
jgi:hypothetical protein